MNTITLSNEIKSLYNQLTESTQTILKGCTILCEGVSIRHLCDVWGIDPHVFEKDLATILKSGLLVERQNILYAPQEVAEVLSDVTLPVDNLNSIITKLVDKTTLSVNDNLLHVRDFFTMGINIINYVVLMCPDGIVYEEFGKLIVNLLRYYEVYAQPDPSIHNYDELQIMRAIRLCKDKIDNKSLLYGRLLTHEAHTLLNGFWHDESQGLLDEALSIGYMQDDTDALPFTFFVSALWFENHGQIGDCLAAAYQSWEITDDEVLKNTAAIYIAYQLALLNEFDTCNDWVKRLDISSLPQFSIIQIYQLLIDALKYNNNEQIVKMKIIQAEWTIDQINSQAPIKARIMYVKSIIEDKWGLLRESNENYCNYATIHARHYASTDGAMYISTASEVHRLTSIGATTHAKSVINEKLDSLQLPHPGYALSVKLDACLSYIKYYRVSGLYPLAETYCELGLDFAKQTIPSAETMSVIQNIFKDREIPESLTGVGLEWTFEYEHLQNMLANKNIPSSEVKLQIERLKELFPNHNHQKDLELINASLLDAHAAISALYKALSHAEQSERFQVSLQCARIAVSLGLIWEAADFFNILLNTEGYKNSCSKYQKIDILIEVATNLENTGSRHEARLIWVQLEALAIGTSKLEDVWQARGNCSFDHEQYVEALEYYDKCLEVVRPEDGLIDLRLSSIYAFRSSCFGALCNYKAAYDNAVKAKQYFPMEDFDAFNLEYNHGFFAICLKKYKEARSVLTRAKTLVRTEEEEDSVDELLSILALKKEKREAYLKQILYKFDE